MSVMAQTDRAHIRKGNRFYRSGAVEQAEVEYSKALTKKDNNPQALYNLACAYMAQNKDSLAASFFEKASNVETSKFRKSKSFHNAGVIYQRHQMYAEAIKAYEQSLRLNPNDNETRYNLVLCKRNQKNQPQENKQKQQKKQKKEQKKYHIIIVCGHHSDDGTDTCECSTASCCGRAVPFAIHYIHYGCKGIPRR